MGSKEIPTSVHLKLLSIVYILVDESFKIKISTQSRVDYIYIWQTESFVNFPANLICDLHSLSAVGFPSDFSCRVNSRGKTTNHFEKRRKKFPLKLMVSLK